jgi:hypothetical protein
MKGRQAIFVALMATVPLTSVAAAGSVAAKQRVAITMHAAEPSPVSPFVLTPLQGGPLKRDSGTQTGALPTGREVMRKGQKVTIYDGITTLKGSRGTLVIRYRSEYVDAGNGYQVGKGTWKVVRGTGQYAHVAGGGLSGDVSLESGPWSSREEGFLAASR